jgi:hypothetical protein
MQSDGEQRIYPLTHSDYILEWGRRGEVISELEKQLGKYSEVLFDGYLVYSNLTEAEQKFTTPENVSAVLDAFNRALKHKSKTK